MDQDRSEITERSLNFHQSSSRAIRRMRPDKLSLRKSEKRPS